MKSSDITLFVILAFALSVVVLLNKNNIPVKLKRGLALFSAVMVVIAFALIIYSFFP
jgi:uncharacterized membrane protein